MKKLISLAVALIMVLSVTALAVPDQGTYPLVDEPAELSVWEYASTRIEDLSTRSNTSFTYRTGNIDNTCKDAF